MIEIYLFVNPIGTECYLAERQILKLVEAEKKKKIQFRFVPFVNLKSIEHLVVQNRFTDDKIHDRNVIFEAIYSATLDFKAVELQGKKKGQQFLLRLQEECGFKKEAYTQELVFSILEELSIDLHEFKKDRASTSLAESYYTDQKVARDMNVEKSPSCVIYNYSNEEEFGVLIEGALCKESITLQKLCQSTKDKNQHSQQNLFDFPPSQPSQPKLHLL